MHLLLPLLIVLAVVLGPGLWVRTVMQRHHTPADRYPFTGAELARRLLDTNGLQQVGVEPAEGGDHYDPLEKKLRLSAPHLAGRSLTAITIAAHEVGHALQDASAYGPLRLRTQLVRWVGPVEKAGALLMMTTPLIVALTRSPHAAGLALLGGLVSLGSGVVIHLLTLPTEFDASFGRALPLLAREGVLLPGDGEGARRLLRAAALTYVAASLASLLNIMRWWAILRR